MPNFSILRQAGTLHLEERVVMQFAMKADIPIQSTRLESLAAHAEALRTGMTVPVGTVEFVRGAMPLAGIPEHNASAVGPLESSSEARDALAAAHRERRPAPRESPPSGWRKLFRLQRQ